jgi:hypothetical protein
MAFDDKKSPPKLKQLARSIPGARGVASWWNVIKSRRKNLEEQGKRGTEKGIKSILLFPCSFFPRSEVVVWQKKQDVNL